MRAWQRFPIAVVLLSLAVVRVIRPALPIDVLTVSLVVVATGLVFLPDAASVFRYVKHLKLWGAEVEMWERIDEVRREIQSVERNESGGNSEATAQAQEVLLAAASDPRAAFMLLSARVESQLRSVAVDMGLDGHKPVVRLMNEISAHHGFSQEFVGAFRDFWSLRNQIVHGGADALSDGQLLALIDLGVDLEELLKNL